MGGDGQANRPRLCCSGLPIADIVKSRVHKRNSHTAMFGGVGKANSRLLLFAMRRKPFMNACQAFYMQRKCLSSASNVPGFWYCRKTWVASGGNTSLCLLGCSLGEFTTLASFSFFGFDQDPTLLILVLPVINGLATSVALETLMLSKGPSQLPMNRAFTTAMNMSFISMVAMEAAMEAADFMLTGSLGFQLWAMPGMLAAGFIVPLPYNYYRLRKYGKTCH